MTRSTSKSRSSSNAVQQATGLDPGQSYVGVLPEYDEGAFVRKRSARRNSSFSIGRLFGSYKRRNSRRHKESRRPSHIVSSPFAVGLPIERKTTIISERRPSKATQHSFSYKPQLLVQVEQQGRRRNTRRRQSVTSTMTRRHTCGHCGRYRSASYHKRHPLANGEWPKPSICTKCAKDKTSSEGSPDSDLGYGKKRNKHRRRSHASMSPRYSLSSWAPESDDSDSTRIHTIINSAPSSVISRRNSRRRSSTRNIRVIEYDEESEESIPWRSRSRSRSVRR